MVEFVWPRSGQAAWRRSSMRICRKHGIIALCVGVAWLAMVFALFVAVGTTARSGGTQVCFGANSC